MAAKAYIDPALFTVVLTSCGRFDLLEQTVTSFLAHFDVERIIVMEDSGDQAGADAFAARFPQVDMRVNNPKLGQMRSIDKAYATVTTPYVFHLEDDWEFHEGVDLEAVTQLMKLRPKISVVCFAFVDYRKDLSKHTERVSVRGSDFDLIYPKANRFWFSYTFNPSVTSMALWREFGPFAKFGTEKGLSMFMKRRGRMVARLVPRAGHHIGDNRHVHDEFRPQRPRTALGWVKYGLAKASFHLRG